MLEIKWSDTDHNDFHRQLKPLGAYPDPMAFEVYEIMKGVTMSKMKSKFIKLYKFNKRKKNWFYIGLGELRYAQKYVNCGLIVEYF